MTIPSSLPPTLTAADTQAGVPGLSLDLLLSGTKSDSYITRLSPLLQYISQPSAWITL